MLIVTKQSAVCQLLNNGLQALQVSVVITKGSLVALQVLEITIFSCCTSSIVQQSCLVTQLLQEYTLMDAP